ncbi:MAG: hypothetical protein ACPGVU_03875 [Limisphaerales bacterium]
MNRTLLLILCDFLLLTILAHTRWEKTERSPVEQQQAVVEEKKDDEEKKEPDDDMLVLLKAELEKESQAREALERQLKFTENNFQSQEQALAKMQQNANTLDTKLKENQKLYDELSRNYDVVSVSAAKNRQDVTRLTGDLNDRQKAYQETLRELAMREEEKRKALAQSSNLTSRINIIENERELMRKQFQQKLDEEDKKREEALAAKATELAAIEAERKAAEKQLLALNGKVQNLSAQMQASEQEKSMLRNSVTNLESQVAFVRQEKQKLQAQTDRLTKGVQALAVTSSELTQEFRDSQAINMNQIFHQFLTNRVQVTISGMASTLFGQRPRTDTIQTILVRDHSGVYAILHVTDSPLSLSRQAGGLSDVTTQVSKNGRNLAFQPLEFLEEDPRLIAIPVNEALASISGLTVYNLTANPVKFPKAVLIGKGGKYYGEAEFRIDPRSPEFVKMKGGFFKALFGEYSPSSGDLVFSKSGELLGVMVNSEYCVLLQHLRRIRGSRIDKQMRRQDTRNILDALKSRVEQLPFATQ